MGWLGGRKKPKSKGRSEPQLFADRNPKTRGRAKAPVKRRRSFTGWLFRLVFALGFWTAAAAAAVFGFIWFTMSQNGVFKIPEREPGLMILAHDGTELAQRGKFFGDTVDLSNLPDHVPAAIIAIEDRRFYSHYGIDPWGLARAMFENVKRGRMIQGGSTLTQQLAKNLFLSHERTIARKAQEAVLAIWLERNFSKDEILQLYLNRVYFGGGATGIDQAARVFYSKTPEELSLMEAATLAAVLKAPSNYNPAKRPEEARERAKLVLKNMVSEGYITESDMLGALAEDARVVSSDYVPATQYVVDMVTEQLPTLTKAEKQSLIVETTIDTVLQLKAEASLRKRLSDNAKRLNVKEGAVVTLDGTGAIRALVGGRSYKRSQYNRAIKAKRQPGSAFKPFVYLAAVEQGFRPESVEIDEPIQIGNWSPENHRRKYLGAVTLETAFALSLNTVAAKLGQAVSPKGIADAAEMMGITSSMTKDATLSLGTSEVSLLELTTAYTPFANGGFAVKPFLIKSIKTREGKVLYEHSNDDVRSVLSDTDLGAMNTMLRSVVRHGTATKAQFGSFDIGGKTGTSQNYRDAWFVGFTPYLVTGVWLGNDDNSPTKNVTGGSLPTLIWRDVMEEAHKDLSVASLPGSIPSQEPLVQMAEADLHAVREVDPEIEVTEATPTARKRRKRGLLERFFGISDDQQEIRKRRLQAADELY